MKHIVQFFAGTGVLISMNFVCRVFQEPTPTMVDSFLTLSVVWLALEAIDKK